jgi:hypothetical protein
VFGKEKEVSKSFTDSTKFSVQMRNGKESKSYSSAFAKAYSDALGNTINQQLINSANLVADFWYTSWVDAGRPDLKEEKHSIKNELKAYKHNKLIEKKLLISTQPPALHP